MMDKQQLNHKTETMGSPSILKKSSKKKSPRRSKSFSGSLPSTPVRSNRRGHSNSGSSNGKRRSHRRTPSNSSLESQASSCTSISPPRSALYAHEKETHLVSPHHQATILDSPESLRHESNYFYSHHAHASQVSSSSSSSISSPQMDWSLVKLGISLITGSTVIGSLWVFYMHDDFSRAPGQLLFCPLNLWGSGIVWILLALYPLFWNMHTSTRQSSSTRQAAAARPTTASLLLPLQLSSIALLLYGLKTASWVGLDAAVTYFLKQQQHMSGFFASQKTLARREEEEVFLQVLTIYTVCTWVWTVCMAMPHLLSIGIVTTGGVRHSSTSMVHSHEKIKTLPSPRQQQQQEAERQRSSSSSFLSIMGFVIFLGGFVAQLCVEIPSFLDTHGGRNSGGGGWSSPLLLWNNLHSIVTPEDSSILVPPSLTQRDILDRGEMLIWIGIFFIHAPRLVSNHTKNTASSSKFLILAALAIMTAGVLSWGAKSGTVGHWVNECDLSDLETVDSMGSLANNDHDASQGGAVATIMEAALTRYNIFSNPIRSFRLVVEVNES